MSQCDNLQHHLAYCVRMKNATSIFRIVNATSPEEAIRKVICYNHRYDPETEQLAYLTFFKNVYYSIYHNHTNRYTHYCGICSNEIDIYSKHIYEHHKPEEYFHLVKGQLEAINCVIIN